MVDFKSPENEQTLLLDPVNLDDQEEVTALIEQRKIAGWDYDIEKINIWNDQISRKARYMWWITITPVTNSTTTPATATQHHETENDKKTSVDATSSTPTIKVGHVALASESHPPDPDLARPDQTILTVGSFFILPQYRKLGLGRASWYAVEARAREIPQCRQIAIDTIDRRYSTDDGPEWGGLLTQYGGAPKGLINEDWYVRMGYEVFKRVPRYPIPQTDILLGSVYMRKYIR